MLYARSIPLFSSDCLNRFLRVSCRPRFSSRVASVFAQQSTDETPEANPARPTVATPATLTPVGYLQFENGGLYASGSGEFATQSSINQVTKLAVSSATPVPSPLRALCAQHDTQVDTSSSDPGGVSRGHSRRSLSRRPESALPSRRATSGCSTEAPRRISTSAPQKTAPSCSSARIWPASTSTSTALLRADEGAAVRRAQFGQTVSIAHPAGPSDDRGGVVALLPAAHSRQCRRQSMVLSPMRSRRISLWMRASIAV